MIIINGTHNYYNDSLSSTLLDWAPVSLEVYSFYFHGCPGPVEFYFDDKALHTTSCLLHHQMDCHQSKASPDQSWLSENPPTLLQSCLQEDYWTTIASAVSGYGSTYLRGPCTLDPLCKEQVWTETMLKVTAYISDCPLSQEIAVQCWPWLLEQGALLLRL